MIDWSALTRCNAGVILTLEGEVHSAWLMLNLRYAVCDGARCPPPVGAYEKSRGRLRVV